MRSGLKTFPNNAKMHYNYANFLKDIGNHKQAAEHYREAISSVFLPPEKSLFGRISGHYEEAVASYKQAVSLDHRYTPAMTNAAASLRQLGRNSEAEDFLKRAVAADRNSEAMEQLGQLYLHAGRTRDAAVIYTQMAQRTPNDTVVMLNYVKVLIDGGEVRQAETVLTELMARAPRNPDVIFAMSHVQQRLGDTQEAMALLRQVGRLAADDMTMMAKVHYELGNLYKDLRQFSQALQGDFDKARQHYEHVLRVEPDNETVLSNLQKLERARRKEQTKN
nr:hypothetical protein BaRGS_009284 [Batillaria attramentaria]